MSRRYASLLAGLAVVTAAHAAEPALDSVTVEARIEAGAPATISMSYFLRPAGAPAVAFISIRFGESRAANVRAFLDGRELSFRSLSGPDSRVDGRVQLPSSAAAAERVHLRLVYEVLPEPDLASEPFDISLPLLVSEWPPSEGRPETFQATVHLPAGAVPLTAFPTEFTRIEPVDRTSDATAYRFVLPVVPALIRIRATTGEPPLLTAERGLDAAAVGLLLGLAVVGWRRLRETLR